MRDACGWCRPIPICNRELAEATPSLKSGVLAIVPSWLLSLVLHAALFVVLAASLPGLRGGIVGDPDGDLRSVGIWVGHSGDGTDGDGAGSGQAKVPSGRNEACSDREAQCLRPSPLPRLLRLLKTRSRSWPSRLRNRKTVFRLHRISSLLHPSSVRASGPGLFRRSDKPSSSNGDTSGSGANGKPGSGRRGSRGSTPFFGIVDVGSRFVYVIDCSGSMFSHDAMGAAKSELLKSLHTLNRFQQFQIVFYNTDQKWLKAPGKMDFRLLLGRRKESAAGEPHSSRKSILTAALST